MERIGHPLTRSNQKVTWTFCNGFNCGPNTSGANTPYAGTGRHKNFTPAAGANILKHEVENTQKR